MNKIDYSKITIPDGVKYSITTPPSNIIFYDNSTGEQREVMRITKDGITSNPDVPTDEGAKAIIRALDGYIKNLVNRTWVDLTDDEIAELSDKILCYQIYDNKESGVFEFARAILRKAHTKVGCAECGVGGGHALYCVTCAENYLKEKST